MYNTRRHPAFSACGLNCGLCPRYYTDGPSRCPGCGGGEEHHPCAIVNCNARHGGIEHCCLCEEYPCRRYAGEDEYDSFISYYNRRRDMEKARQTGVEAYLAGLEEKMEILQHLLEKYNDGRRKSLFCLAVNLLELPDVQKTMEQIRAGTRPEMTEKEKAVMAAQAFAATAKGRGIELKLRKKGG